MIVHIFCRAKWDQIDDCQLESIVKSLKYSLETDRLPLFTKLWKLFHSLKLERDSKEYQLILDVVKEAGGELAALAATKDRLEQ